MAENAYQLVQGNFDRVAAVSLAQKDARIPPSLEVLNTPRGTEFTFTNRVTLHFDDLDPAVPASNPWPGIPMTPRATGGARTQRWLGAVFWATTPADVHCTGPITWRADDARDAVDPRHGDAGGSASCSRSTSSR